MYTDIIHTTLLEHCVTLTCFNLQWAIFREYDWYISTARSTTYIPDVKFILLSSMYYIMRHLH